jgi:hypothetical protein
MFKKRKMQGGGGDPNFLKIFFNSKFFWGKFFFGLKKLIKIFEKVFRNLHLQPHLVPVRRHPPDYLWKKIVKNREKSAKIDQKPKFT